MQRLLLLVSLFLLAFAPMARAQTPQQAAFYVNGATGVDSPSAGIPSAGPLGWEPNILPTPQGWKTIQYAITQVQAWMAANTPTVPTALIYIQGGQTYSAAANGESFPVLLPPAIALEGTFIGLGFTAFPQLQPAAGVAAIQLDPNRNYFDRAVIGGVRFSNCGFRYLRLQGGSYGIDLGSAAGIRHNPRIEDCEFLGQTAAGIRVDTTSGINDPKIYRNTFRDFVRGVDLVARGNDTVLFADVEECTFESTASMVSGTGIHLIDLSTNTGAPTPNAPRVDGLFRSNNYERIQRGIYVEATGNQKIRAPQVFRSRFAAVVGNAVELKLTNNVGQDLVVTDCVMMNCAAGVKVSGVAAGGAHALSFDNNTYYQCGVGLDVDASGSGSIALSTQKQLARQCSQYGYRVQVAAPMTLAMTAQRDRILDNVRGVLVQGTAAGTFRMQSSMICRSQIFQAIRCAASGLALQFDGLTIADNFTGLDAAAFAAGSTFSNLAFDGNFVDVAAVPVAPAFTYCCFGNSSQPGVGNLNVTNPQFDRPFYKLRPSSPCINSGSMGAMSSSADYEGDPRGMSSSGACPGAPDIGADEWSFFGSARSYGNVGFEQFNVFPQISSPTTVIQSPSTSPLLIKLTNARQPLFGTPGVGAVLFLGFNDVNQSLPFDLAPLGWPGSYVQLDPATSMGFLSIQQSGPQAGEATAMLPVAPGLSGVTVTAQWFVLMPPPYDVVTSDALRITVGNYNGATPPVIGNMVAIQPGTFSMGSTQGRSNEAPVHSVAITRPFWIGRYEVTQAEYQAVMGSNPSTAQGANKPVESVTWTQAMAYCSQLTQQQSATGCLPQGYSYRLPTEAEWEYACRAGTTTQWNVGSSLVCADANIISCVGGSVVVGSYPANAWGLHDCHGNVWEWVLDADPATSGPATGAYSAAPATDPYVSTGAGRIVRGGVWTAPAIDASSSVRFTALPATPEIGFRIVLAPTLLITNP
jgi:formylglycine-generating enzyme required for sulfatase activity